MKIKIIDPSTDKRWDEFVADHPAGTVFHTSNWARVIQRTYGYKPYYFILEDSEEKIKAGLPSFLITHWLTGNRLICLPFTDECSPIITHEQNVDIVIFTIVKMIKERKLNYVEIRGGKADFLNSFNFENHNYYKLFRLNLFCGIDNLWKGFKQKSIRYPIKKAQATNLKIENRNAENDMQIFYKLNLLTRQKHGIIPQPYRFFKNIYQELIIKKLAFLLIAQYKGKPVAASIFFLYKDTIYHKFNASDTNYLKYQPNHLILWEAIKYGVKMDYKYLDLGRTSPDNWGLMSFKRHWGAQEIDLPYYYWPKIKGAAATKERDMRYRIVSSVLKRTPASILKITGNLFYKHLG